MLIVLFRTLQHYYQHTYSVTPERQLFGNTEFSKDIKDSIYGGTRYYTINQSINQFICPNVKQTLDRTPREEKALYRFFDEGQDGNGNVIISHKFSRTV